MEKLLKAVAFVLEWHDENLTDGVHREFVISELRAAYNAAQHRVQPDLLPAPACCASFVAYGEHHKDCRFAKSASR